MFHYNNNTQYILILINRQFHSFQTDKGIVTQFHQSDSIYSKTIFTMHIIVRGNLRQNHHSLLGLLVF